MSRIGIDRNGYGQTETLGIDYLVFIMTRCLWLSPGPTETARDRLPCFPITLVSKSFLQCIITAILHCRIHRGKKSFAGYYQTESLTLETYAIVISRIFSR